MAGARGPAVQVRRIGAGAGVATAPAAVGGGVGDFLSPAFGTLGCE
ncbi:hypothetical protein ACGF5F_16665 [Streptomyces sp. NPDC047821]